MFSSAPPTFKTVQCILLRKEATKEILDLYLDSLRWGTCGIRECPRCNGGCKVCHGEDCEGMDNWGACKLEKEISMRCNLDSFDKDLRDHLKGTTDISTLKDSLVRYLRSDCNENWHDTCVGYSTYSNREAEELRPEPGCDLLVDYGLTPFVVKLSKQEPIGWAGTTHYNSGECGGIGNCTLCLGNNWAKWRAFAENIIAKQAFRANDNSRDCWNGMCGGTYTCPKCRAKDEAIMLLSVEGALEKYEESVKLRVREYERRMADMAWGEL